MRACLRRGSLEVPKPILTSSLLVLREPQSCEREEAFYKCLEIQVGNYLEAMFMLLEVNPWKGGKEKEKQVAGQINSYSPRNSCLDAPESRQGGETAFK